MAKGALASLLGFGGKKKTTPGLWLEVLNGSRKAIRTMVEYNKRDVTLLEKVFKRLIPYVPNHINRELFGSVGCPYCGSRKIQSRGTHKAIGKIYKRFQCQAPACLGWFREYKSTVKSTTKYRVI